MILDFYYTRLFTFSLHLDYLFWLHAFYTILPTCVTHVYYWLLPHTAVTSRYVGCARLILFDTRFTLPLPAILPGCYARLRLIRYVGYRLRAPVTVTTPIHFTTFVWIGLRLPFGCILRTFYLHTHSTFAFAFVGYVLHALIAFCVTARVATFARAHVALHCTRFPGWLLPLVPRVYRWLIVPVVRFLTTQLRYAFPVVYYALIALHTFACRFGLPPFTALRFFFLVARSRLTFYVCCVLGWLFAAPFTLIAADVDSLRLLRVRTFTRTFCCTGSFTFALVGCLRLPFVFACVVYTAPLRFAFISDFLLHTHFLYLFPDSVRLFRTRSVAVVPLRTRILPLPRCGVTGYRSLV